jgi:methionyl-tRNA formyltransferase
MPIVPALVLDTARLGVLNAHNGALPGYRGMDAVGWALLNNDPVVCTLHLARPAVDTGEVLACHVVPIDPLHTLRRRVKATQMQLLVSGAAYVAATGHLPEATPQPQAWRQFYRLHPHLKRLLDSSPYGRLNPLTEQGCRNS